MPTLTGQAFEVESFLGARRKCGGLIVCVVIATPIGVQSQLWGLNLYYDGGPIRILGGGFFLEINIFVGKNG